MFEARTVDEDPLVIEPRYSEPSTSHEKVYVIVSAVSSSTELTSIVQTRSSIASMGETGDTEVEGASGTVLPMVMELVTASESFEPSFAITETSTTSPFTNEANVLDVLDC